MSGGPYVASDAEALLGQLVGDGECVAYVRAVSAAPHTSSWIRGSLVRGDRTIARGTAIATFGENGKYLGNADGKSHAAIYLSQDSHGLTVYDQWKHPTVQPAHERLIHFGGASPVNDGDKFHVIV